jgi:hypothetical protein
MTTQEYQEAYDDDSDQVRGWPAQDAQEPEPEGPEPDPAPCNCPECLTYRLMHPVSWDQDAPEPPSDVEREFALEGDPLAMWDEIVRLRTLCGKAADHLERVVAQRDEARAMIATDDTELQGKDAEIERLQNELHGVLCDRAEAWATIARLQATIIHAVVNDADNRRAS